MVLYILCGAEVPPYGACFLYGSQNLLENTKTLASTKGHLKI